MKKEKIKAPTVITCHVNADFDALSSIIAAGKIYPDSVLIFPGSQEKNLKNFFIQSATYLYNFMAFKDIDPESVKQLIVVDTRQKSRVKHVAPLLDKKDIEIHLYDHHPDSEEDIHGKLEVIKPWGSTTAIISEILMEKEVELTEDEATILGLGIYEDTGCFTFNSTTTHDFKAASWLLSQGMDLNMVSDLTNRDLSAEQISILNALLESATSHKINGIDVVVAEVSLDHYVGDFALLAHKLLDMENIRVLFAISRMQDRVHVVARSRTTDVNVGKICSSMGGGGHSFAASATIKHKSLTQVKDELFGLLYSQVNPQILVTHLMSSPSVSVEENKSLTHASEIMTRFGLKAVPIISKKDGICTGILEHQTADKAVGHGLGKVSIKEYMITDFKTLTSNDDIYNVMEIIIGQRQRLIPIVEDDKLTGVVTRTDLINNIIKEPARIPETLLPEKKRERNIKKILRDRLPDKIYNLLDECGRIARDMGYELFIVGGFVRDILLDRDNLDVDLVVEGDGIAYARKLATELGGRVRAHHKFQTAVVIMDDEQKIDVATARLEYYEHPAALPTVELSSIKMDLYRRDFSINALAAHLNPDNFGKLVDFFGGQRDIKDKVIRVLHSLSFVEDPTRIIRAIRFEQRFSFRIGAQTEKLIKNAVDLNIFHKLSGSRIFHELRMIFEENNPLGCISRMENFGLLRNIHPLLKLTPGINNIMLETEKVINWFQLLYTEEVLNKWMLYLLGLLNTINDTQVKIIFNRFNLSQKQENSFFILREQIRDAVAKLYRWHKEKGRLSLLSDILGPLPIEGLLFVMARTKSEELKKKISYYITKLRNIETQLSGKDLKNMGIEPGPVFGKILHELKSAQIDGLPCDRQTQIDWVKNHYPDELPKE
ncbi:CBS domain-containing protein [Desulfonatronovibrio magnus]|uniref:CBS domain-containing protein n=1 Tax=Desulfonatronovibrio magnus TaxID=698827 RepID=UPI0005EB33FB|nr:CBS domain-containing protein [Desulfonatronovibrio magnus]RQD57659.1 MAG: CBS domain-containing protein [Desulfonatronovibrio sp. MSAO_Bac4]